MFINNTKIIMCEERRNQRPMENGAEKSKNRRWKSRPTRLELPKNRPVDFAAQSTGSSQG